MIIKLAEALDFAHQRNLYCFNLRPGTILVDAETTPFLIGENFIQVKWLEPDFCVYGNPRYLSPERITGDLWLNSSASDVFGLGLILYEMLTGRRPYRFQGGPELVEEILHGRIEPPSHRQAGGSTGFDEICATALAKSPTERYPRMSDFAKRSRIDLKGSGLVYASSLPVLGTCPFRCSAVASPHY